MATGSSLLLDELWRAEDGQFLVELLRFEGEKHLAHLAERLYTDKRPFARRMLLAYLDDGCDRDHHRALVKRLFKRAEAAGDDEAMGHFLVAFDRLARREVREVQRWNWQTRESEAAFELQRMEPPGRRKSSFTLTTRLYLARRAWRYFRLLGWREPDRYLRAMLATLPLYQDQHLDKPECLLDAWGLVHALYHGSDVVARRPRGAFVRPGRTLAQLVPAPFKPKLWQGRKDDLFALLETAGSRTVRVWAMNMLRRHHDLAGLPMSRLRLLLRSSHEEVVLFGAELLGTAVGLEGLPIREWLELLEIENTVALPIICALMEKHVAPSRLRAEECVKLAGAPAAPVALLGLRWLREKRGVGLDSIIALGEAQAPLVRAEAVDWLMGLLRESAEARPEHLRDLIDSRYPDTRGKALAAMSPGGRFRDEGVIWAALPESPHDDVRATLVAHLEERLSALAPGSSRHVWITALLAVHRGGRAKPVVARQISRRIADRPAEAPELLPLLAIALRSLRLPEKRAALAALVRAAEANPALHAPVRQFLPELTILDDAATARASAPAKVAS